MPVRKRKDSDMLLCADACSVLSADSELVDSEFTDSEFVEWKFMDSKFIDSAFMAPRTACGAGRAGVTWTAEARSGAASRS